ncbi:MAG: hypothetical protein A2W46_05715 [Alphaproteobacteria bacterium RIFCSPHIGHO2_12_42_13]|nr:MAG: hypothetical protein A2Z80_01715 [Alphaproteobacteria bacterium GWA2_41_27]OFW85170.1 MAG: hypothetical protein A3E50_06250 [Alphaproteobacteria bacterium RIFCSPHIGHO2_12_FULL_42_100]OFW91535.1 MAG: hypothetical protein A2W46_05715 [Alphaproteobacteria bacterium RIFCSPHIGHO2_12_42_13]OFW93242.1 MAG: hypothetical protein A3C41_02110 [Alphaproteobacteria bacterium RIFCSPHIGHO2_02_FULL_42_30]OFX01505.1 MAG: hypothetical protein A2W62_05360 [Alphaproteobacteria bacterium RIFCSPLOWO2_02_42_7
MAELFLILLGLTLVVLIFQGLERAETKLVVATLKWTLVGVLLLAGIYLTLVGRLLHVAVIAVLLILLLRKDFHEWLKKKTSPLPLPRPLTREEAAALLKVELKATPDEILEAFQKANPKNSTDLDRLEQARDVLLGKKR